MYRDRIGKSELVIFFPGTKTAAIVCLQIVLHFFPNTNKS